MVIFFFLLVGIPILILFCQKYLAYLRIYRLKNKIKNNPLIGIKQEDNSYYYKEKGYTISYRIRESPAGIKIVEWLSLKHRLTTFEERVRNLKRALDKFFLYQRWLTLFRPSVVIVLFASLIIFYLGIKDYSLKRMEHFRWIIAQITGISPESIRYAGEGWFKIAGQKSSKDREVEPITISFNPLRWLFLSDAANVSLWSKKLNRYVDYPVTINDKGDVWLGKKSSQIHGRVLGNEVIWDAPQGVREVLGHDIVIEDGKLKIIDE